MPLNRQPNLTDPDGFYEELINAQRDLSDEQSQLMNAKLILILANHIGDREVLREALTIARLRAEIRQGATDAQRRLDRLTEREREVLMALVDGMPNKGVAQALGISPRTVEVHRARLMDKLEVASIAEAVKIALAAGG